MVAALGNGPLRSDKRSELGKNTLCTEVVLSRQRKQILDLYWRQGFTQEGVAEQTHLAQQTVGYHIAGIRRAYAQARVPLPDRAKPRPHAPKAPSGKRHATPGVVEIDVCRIVNMLRGLPRARSGSVSEGMILGTLLMAIDDDRVQDVVGRLVRS